MMPELMMPAGAPNKVFFAVYENLVTGDGTSDPELRTGLIFEAPLDITQERPLILEIRDGADEVRIVLDL